MYKYIHGASRKTLRRQNLNRTNVKEHYTYNLKHIDKSLKVNKMHTEIEYAVNFLVDTLSQKMKMTTDQCEKLRERLRHHLEKRYENHWYSDKPMKGSAYRCINISAEDCSVDQVLRDAAEECDISVKTLLAIFPKGLALWVDPIDVSCRLGKGAIFPIYKKISEKPKPLRSTSSPGSVVTPGNYQRRPQQRPRSISPPQNTSFYEKEGQFQTRPRSTTPPGFSSMDAGQLYQSYVKPSLSSEDLQKLWNTIPNSTTYKTPYTNTKPSTYSQASYPKTTIDSSYSFNQYSSYYNQAAKAKNANWKKTQHVAAQPKQQKSNWVDDEVYNRYHWSRRDVNNTMAVASNNTSMNNYYTSALQAQEVC